MAAYLIADIEITNPKGYESYRPMAAECVARHGGKFIARGGAVVPLEGRWDPKRVVIIEFPSLGAAQSFYNSDEYQKALKVRMANSTARAIIVDGAPAA